MTKCRRARFQIIPAALRCRAAAATCCAGPWNLKASPSLNSSGGISTTRIGAITPSATCRSKSSMPQRTKIHKINRRIRMHSSQSRFTRWMLGAFLVAALSSGATAQQNSRLTASIQKVIDRPEFKHANFGIEFYDLADGTVVYSLNADKLFTPASTTKLLTEGTVLAKFGKDYRFHTAIYRTGSIDKKGKLKGDLIVVASGDPNLSNRIQPDNTLAFQDEDHSYGGPAVAGDPLTVIKDLAKQIRAKGIRRIDGRILIDTSLFPDGPREGGTNVVMSSIMVNDNVIDVVARPGAKAGDQILISTSPQTSYTHFINHAITTAADTKPDFNDPAFAANSDGSVNITLSGTLPLA